MNQNKFPLPLKISWYSAIVYSAISVPMELVRRWHQLLDWHYFITWFDEFIVAGFLLFSVWKTYKSIPDGQHFLAASWGFASGMMFASFFIQLNNMNLPEPAPVSVSTVVTIKGIFFAICIISLIFSLIKVKEK